MTDSSRRLLGTGIYTISEASRQTGISTRRIQRWPLGYHFRYAGELHESPAVVAPELPLLDGTLGLSVLDLQDAQFVEAFLTRGAEGLPIANRY